MTFACVFPGQGSQSVGMGKELADADAASRKAFETADEVLGFSLSKLCWEGPSEDLALTENTQPAILVASVASWRRVESLGVSPSLFAGHSLGEYSALVAAGTLAFEDAVLLVRERGRLMQEAVPVGVGAMAAVIGPSAEAVEEVAAKAAEQTAEVCSVANYNAPGQTVIAGSKAAVDCAIELAKEVGAKRSILLPVSAPFHCALMRKAREGMEPLLRSTEFLDPVAPVVCNVDAVAITTGSGAREALIRQIDGAVRWVESVETMIAAGVQGFVEVGAGGVLSGLNRRIDRSVKTVGAGTPEAIDAVRVFVAGLASAS